MSDDVAMGVAFIWGVLYNAFVGWLHKNPNWYLGMGWLEGAGGILGVLIIGSFVHADKRYAYHALGETCILTNGQSAAWLLFRLFLAAGIPMMFGAIRRFLNTIG